MIPSLINFCNLRGLKLKVIYDPDSGDRTVRIGRPGWFYRIPVPVHKDMYEESEKILAVLMLKES